MRIDFDDTKNAAFAEGDREGEVARILKDVARKVCLGQISGPVHDINGNKVGQWSMEEIDHD